MSLFDKDDSLFDKDDQWAKATEEHMQNPQPGDRFSEMFAFWAWIESVDEGGLVVWEGNGAHLVVGEAEGGVKRVVYPDAAAFRKKYAYGTIPGYSLHWIDNRPATSAAGRRVTC